MSNIGSHAIEINVNDSNSTTAISRDETTKIINNNKSSNEFKKQSICIPDGLERLLIDFTVDVLKRKPKNLVEHAIDYFTKMLENSSAVGQQLVDRNTDEMFKKAIKDENKTRNTLDTTSSIDFNNNNSVANSETNNENEYHSRSRRNSVFTRTFNPEVEIDQDNTNSNTKVFSLDEQENENSNESENVNKENEVKREKNNEIRVKISKILRSIVMFKYLPDDDFNQIIDNMFERRCNAGDVIIKEGDDGNYFYVIDKGMYEIFKKAHSRNNNHTKNSNDETEQFGNKVGEYKDIGYFGELALLYNQPRSATIISRENDGILWVMNRQTFQRLVITNTFKRRKLYEDFLKSVTLLQESMNDYERIQVADSLISQNYNKGDCIIKQGDSANGMYFIEEGQVQIVKDANNEILLNLLGKGDYFGELALVNKASRSASAYVHSDTCKLAFLDIDAFERLMGPCINVIKKNISNYRSV